MRSQTMKWTSGERPILKTYILDSYDLSGVVIICPGGGYQRTSPRESEPVALKFNEAGYHAVVLDYRVSPDRYPLALEDLAHTMKIIYDHRQEWKIDIQKIVICGFSAGGHLAASFGIYWNEFGEYKPNALILCYPVITSGSYKHEGSFHHLLGENPDCHLLEKLSLEKHIHSETPPTFIWHTVEDQSVPVENTLLFVEGLRKNKISFEMHIYPTGRHGMSLALEETASDSNPFNVHVSTWMKLCIQWLDNLFKK